MNIYTELIVDITGIIGIIAFAVSGATTAIAKRADLFGVIMLSAVTATGGGVCRDIMLGVCPPKAFFDCTYILYSIITALIVFAAARLLQDTYFKNSERIDAVTNIFDALGLGIFSVTGSRSAIEYGFSQNDFLVIMTGMITATGGGFLRDIMVKEIPFILKKRIYALASLLGSTIFYFLYRFGIGYSFSVFFASGCTFLLRMLATKFRWNLPVAY